MKHNQILCNDIRNSLQAQRHKTKWERFRTMNFYIGEPREVYIGNDLFIVKPLLSYETIVGYIDIQERTMYEIGNYSITTSKQLTMFYNISECLTRVYVDRIYC